MPGVIPGGKVDLFSQHCRFCRFSHADRGPPSCKSRIQAGLRPMTTCHLALWVAKAARSRQEVAMIWQGQRQKRQGLVGMQPPPGHYAYGCRSMPVADSSRYGVVQGAGGVWWRQVNRTKIPQMRREVKGRT